ncbi:ABC transporter permease [Marinilactibacillus psychrotolerans]|uniref:ABC transporter permease n=2 Tax=Marinilactibacillus psychrotolerans TaxID=191770 RepID=A0A5R9C7J1_9LACT|nr:ABC transporter permease [Marinilactibacillus psychrotolerans]TLQ09230.1 ABC transporter permease [Marinilactibacillus psychrotolerans]
MERRKLPLIRNHKNLLSGLLVPMLSIVFGFLFGAILMLAFGYNPLLAYDAMISGVFTSPYFMGEALRQATALTFTGLGFALAFKAGFFNIGVSGQALAGWISAIWVALILPDLSKFLLLPLCIIVGMLVGAIWAAIAGVLRAYFGTSEVIVTIMLNYTMLQLTNFIIRDVLTDGGNTSEMVGENASLSLSWLTALTQNSRLNAGIFIAIIVVILYWIFMTRTTAGFEIRAVGLNSHASSYAGMSAKKNIILSMFLSGALAGLGGAIHGLGTFGNIFTQGGLPEIGFDGIAVALLGLGNPIGIFFSSILFGVLDIGAGFMPNRAGVPDEMANIVTAAIIFFIGANYMIRYFIDKRAAKKQTSSSTQGGKV